MAARPAPARRALPGPALRTPCCIPVTLATAQAPGRAARRQRSCPSGGKGGGARAVSTRPARREAAHAPCPSLRAAGRAELCLAAALRPCCLRVCCSAGPVCPVCWAGGGEAPACSLRSAAMSECSVSAALAPAGVCRRLACGTAPSSS